jgi:hypothetical protein
MEKLRPGRFGSAFFVPWFSGEVGGIIESL